MSSSRTSHSATSSLSSTEARPRLVTVPSEASIDLTSPRVPSPVDASLQTADHNHPANRLMHMSSGVSSTRVGLGSPQLDFRPEWTWRENGEARHSASAEKTGKPNGLVNRISGLPSPPGTESDVALPRANNAEQHSSRPPASIERHSSTRLVPRRTSTSSARPAPARTLSLSSSTSQKLPSSGSSISSSNRKSIRPRRSPGMSRSSSSSSQLAFMTAPSTTRGMSTEDPHPHNAVPGNQLLHNHSAPNSVSSRRSGSAAVSPAQASSSVLPEGRMSNRLSSSWENGLDAQEIAEEPRRASGGGLDARIRDAEEKIRSSSVRRLTSEGDDSRGTIRGYTSYARGSPVKASPTAIDSSTIRRSATVSEYSGRPRHADTPLRDRFAEYEERGTPESMRANVQQRSGGSAESGRRKPLPSEFMSGAAFTPSPEASFSPRSMRLQGLAYSKHQESPLASRYHTTSRLSREIDGVPSPSRSRMYPSPSKIDGLKRSSAALQRLPAGTDGRGNPSPYRADMLERHRRPASVLDTSYDRQHYLSRTPAESDRATPSRMRNGLAPSDSVSAVGGRTFEPREEGKNPLDVIRRIEQSRAEHNKQWQADRAQSVIGDREPTGFSRPPSRYEQHFTPHRIRPATSMSTIHHDGPRTAPVERYRRIYRSEARAQPVFLRAWERLRAVLPPTVFLPTTLDRPSSSAGCGTGPSIRLGSSAGPSTMYISDTGSRCGPSSGSNTRSTASPLLTPAVLDQVIAHVPPVILFRITHMALAPLRPDRRKLDLSTLCSASEAVRDIDFGAAVSIFGVDKTEVTHLSLAADDLTELPDWPVFPFPNLQVLNLSNNPSLTSLPFSLTQLPRLRRLRIFMTGLRASLDMPTLASSPLPLRARPSTSTTSTIMPAGQQSRHGPGPPSLVEMVIKLLLPLLKRWRRPVRREGLVEGHTDGRADTDRKGDTDRRADLDGKGDMDGKGDTERERAGGGAQDAGEPSLTDGLPPHLVDLIDRSFNCDLCTVLVTPATLTDAGSGDRPRGPLMLCWLVQEHQQQQQQQRQQHARKRSRQTRPGKEVIIEGRLCTSCMNARVDLLHGM